jgi:hypothetical protein
MKKATPKLTISETQITTAMYYFFHQIIKNCEKHSYPVPGI